MAQNKHIQPLRLYNRNNNGLTNRGYLHTLEGTLRQSNSIFNKIAIINNSGRRLTVDLNPENRFKL